MTIDAIRSEQTATREREARAYRLCVSLLYPFCLAEAVVRRLLPSGQAHAHLTALRRTPARSVFEDARARVHEIAPYVFVR